jgi:hypothetical protein
MDQHNHMNIIMQWKSKAYQLASRPWSPLYRVPRHPVLSVSRPSGRELARQNAERSGDHGPFERYHRKGEVGAEQASGNSNYRQQVYGRVERVETVLTSTWEMSK